MITFYPTVSRKELGNRGAYYRHHTILLVASSYAADSVRKYERVRGSLPVPVLPECVTEKAADCGGFVATFKWGGVYPYTPDQYFEWLYAWLPDWAAMMDYCCEDEITSGNAGIVRERQDKTTEMAHYFWKNFKYVPWTWVPTIQGWTVEDYQRHATEMKPLIEEMRAFYTFKSSVTFKKDYFRVGIGTLCRRASSQMIREVILAVTAILGDVPIHLWGVKKTTFKDKIALPQCVTSVDSAAFNGMFGHGRNQWKQDIKPDGSAYRQAEWCLQVALPRYIEGLEEALSPIKQAMLF
jgi:hypothetical protein